MSNAVRFVCTAMLMMFNATCVMAADTVEQKTLPHVVVIATGGTIAGKGANATVTTDYVAGVIGIGDILEAVPELKTLADVTGQQVFNIDSSLMTPEKWLVLTKDINETLAQPETAGVVVTHGTDTMEETAYFLNLTVKSLKPVVLTGSMRPATAISPDGPMNIYDSVAVAASPLSSGKGVFVVMNDVINAAREVTKKNTHDLDTFATPQLGMLGYVEVGKPFFYRLVTRKNTAQTEFDVSRLDNLPKVGVIYCTAGGEEIAEINALVEAGVKGIVVAGVGDGNIPATIIPALTDARKKGVVIVRSSRVGSGRVARNGDVDDDKYDFVAGDNLNPQKARILLMLALTRTSNTKAIQEMFREY
jgi:L-asparaginase